MVSKTTMSFCTVSTAVILDASMQEWRNACMRTGRNCCNLKRESGDVEQGVMPYRNGGVARRNRT